MSEKYETIVVKGDSDNIHSRISDYKKMGFELNGEMLLYRGSGSGGHMSTTYAEQPMKRLIIESQLEKEMD